MESQGQGHHQKHSADYALSDRAMTTTALPVQSLSPQLVTFYVTIQPILVAALILWSAAFGIRYQITELH